MSYLKEKLYRIENQGFQDINKRICKYCLNDKYFIKLMNKKGNISTCDYCKRERVKTLPMNDVMGVVLSVINEDYLRAEDYAGLDADIDNYDMIYEEIGQYLEIDNEDILHDMANSLTYSYVSKETLYGNEYVEHFENDWDEYHSIVEKLDKFDVCQILSLGKKTNAPELIKRVIELLDSFYFLLKNNQINNFLTPATPIYRAVDYIKNISDYGLSYYPATLLGTAPSTKASNNRMSVKGEMVFYGANLADATVAELPTSGKNITLATFNLNKKIKIMNFSRIEYKKFPSYFDLSKRNRFNNLMIINELADEVSKQINTDEDKNEYKHLQLLAKYMNEYHKLKGVAFKSSKYPKAICYALFIDNINCIDEGDKVNINIPQLILKNVDSDIDKDMFLLNNKNK